MAQARVYKIRLMVFRRRFDGVGRSGSVRDSELQVSQIGVARVTILEGDDTSKIT